MSVFPMESLTGCSSNAWTWRGQVRYLLMRTGCCYARNFTCYLRDSSIPQISQTFRNTSFPVSGVTGVVANLLKRCERVTRSTMSLACESYCWVPPSYGYESGFGFVFTGYWIREQ